MAHNRVIITQATPWLKKNDSQTTVCKILLPPDLTDAPQVADTQGAHRLLFRLQSGQGQLQRRQWSSGRGPGAYVQVPFPQVCLRPLGPRPCLLFVKKSRSNIQWPKCHFIKFIMNERIHI